MEYSNDIRDVCKSIEDYNPKVLIRFNDMIANMISNKKKLHSVVPEVFIRGKKLNIFFGVHYIVLLFCTKRCKTRHHTHFYCKDFKKREIQLTAILPGAEITFVCHIFLPCQAKCPVSKTNKISKRSRC